MRNTCKPWSLGRRTAHCCAVFGRSHRAPLSGVVAADRALLLSPERMSRISASRAIDRTLTVQPGMVLPQVNMPAPDCGLFYLINLSARGACSVDTSSAANVGGFRVICEGTTCERLAALNVVAGKDERFESRRAVVKGARGYDFRQWLFGSEYLLGIAVEVTRKLSNSAFVGAVAGVTGGGGIDARVRMVSRVMAIARTQCMAIRADGRCTAGARGRLSVLRGGRV
ncbi:MAG: FAD-binding oxidoreductase [Rhodanobacter sp.]